MSRVGIKPISVPSGVTVSISGQDVSVSGPKGKLAWRAPATATLAHDAKANLIRIGRTGDEKQARANHGLTRALIANMVTGACEGFERRIQIYGTGYNCKLQGKTLHLNVGFSGRRRGIGAQFELPVPDGLEVTVEKEAARGDNEPAQFVVRGCDKQKVGQFAAEVRALRRSEPYNGKGIRYEGEVIKRKQGKALSGSGG